MTTVKQLKMQYRNGIEDAKNRKGLTHAEIAEMAGLTRETVMNAVNKPHTVSYTHLTLPTNREV